MLIGGGEEASSICGGLICGALSSRCDNMVGLSCFACQASAVKQSTLQRLSSITASGSLKIGGGANGKKL